MNTFIKRFLGFSVGPVFGAMISFITIPITTYFISPSEYGKASMFSLYQILIVAFLYIGLDQSFLREYHDYKNKDNLLKNALLFPLILSILVFVLILLKMNVISNLIFGAPYYKIATLLFALTIISMTIERFVLLSIRMEEKSLEFSFLNIIIRFNILIFTLLFVLFIRRDFLGVVYSSAIGQLLADLYLIIRYNRYLNFKNFKLDKNVIMKMLKFGVPLIIAANLTNLLDSFDRISLKSWSTFYEVGIFTAALKIATALKVVQTSFTNFWIPTAYRWYSEKKDIKYFKLISETMLLIMSVLFCFILIFKGLITVLLSNDYSSSKFIIGLLCLQPIMYTISETTSLGIIFTKKSHYNIWVSLLSFIPNIVLNVVLVPKYGAIGASVATGVSYIFFFLGRSYFSNKNWLKIQSSKHLIVSFLLLLASLINTCKVDFIILINIIITILIISVQINTIYNIFKVFKLRKSRKSIILEI